MEVSQPSVMTYDPFDEEVLADPEPYDRLALASGPVLYFPQYDLYALCQYEHVRAAFADWRRFCSGHGTGIVHTKKAGNWRRQSPVLENDPPEHGRYRRILQKVLTGRSLLEIKDRFAKEADVMVSDLVDRGHFDAQTELAAAFPLVVVPTMLGLAAEDRDAMVLYSELNFNSMGPNNNLRQASVARAAGIPARVEALCCRESLSKDGLGARIYEECEIAGISDTDAAILVRTFFSASMDTTAIGIGMTIHALASNPEHWRMARENSDLLRSAFDESLRRDAPSPYIGRTTTEEVHIDGVTIPADSKVLLLVAAANRDPAQYGNPDEFDPHRQKSTHVAFGVGIHACIGQPLARLEAELVLTALARHARTITLDGTPTRLLNNWLRGFANLPIIATRSEGDVA